MKPALACVLMLCLSPSLALAQEDDAGREDNWYRVELIIFANRDPEAALSERWPLLPELSYPDKWQRLRDDKPRIQADRDYSLLRVEDTVPAGTRYDLAWERSIQDLLDEYERSLLYRQPDIELNSLIDLSVPRTRVKLDASEQEFAGQRRRIDRSSSLDVLFHEAWLQPVRDQEHARPLIMDTPVQFGDYPELQGSILLYSGRYLHLVTDLWLNTAGSYLDSNWSMPRPPLPVDQSYPELLPFAVPVTDDWLSGLPASSAETIQAIPDDFDLMQTDVLEVDVAQEELEMLSPEPAEDDEETRLASPAEMEAFMSLPVVDYPFRHAVNVQQRRRMRSGELHYIDHPLLGIIIKVSRHEFAPFVTEPDPGPALAGNP